MTKTKPFAVLAAKAKADPVRRARIETYKRAMEDALALAELRTERGFTQAEVAEALGVTQANISRIEHEEDLYLSTLRGYVQGLGGDLEVNAVFPDERFTLGAADDWVGKPAAGEWSAAIPGNTPVPRMIEAHLRADRNLDPETAALLARMFNAAYEKAAENTSSKSDQKIAENAVEQQGEEEEKANASRKSS